MPFSTSAFTFDQFLIQQQQHRFDVDEVAAIVGEPAESDSVQAASYVSHNGVKESAEPVPLPLPPSQQLLKSFQRYQPSMIELSTDLKPIRGPSPFYGKLPEVEQWVSERSSSGTTNFLTTGINLSSRKPTCETIFYEEVKRGDQVSESLWGDPEDVAVLRRSSKQRFITMRVLDIISSGNFFQNNLPLDTPVAKCSKIIVVSRFWEHLFLLGGLFEAKLGILCAHLYPKVN